MLVTGGSRGIGAATARLAGECGYRVAVNYIFDAGAAEMVVSDIVADGGQAYAVRADISDENPILAMYEELDLRFGQLDVLVNNAGVVDEALRHDRQRFIRLRVDRIARGNISTMPPPRGRSTLSRWRWPRRLPGSGSASTPSGPASSIRKFTPAAAIPTGWRGSAQVCQWPARGRLKKSCPRNPLLWLASDATSYTTGSVVDVSGGRAI